MTAHTRLLVARARLTDDELRTAAARFGIVGERDALPLRERDGFDQRMRETGDIMAAARTARELRTTHDEPFYCSSDALEEQYRGGPVWVGGTLVGADLVKSPIYAAGIASLARVVA